MQAPFWSAVVPESTVAAPCIPLNKPKNNISVSEKPVRFFRNNIRFEVASIRNTVLNYLLKRYRIIPSNSVATLRRSLPFTNFIF
jgi:hypothetical protein